jgi:asparagine synthase (glutamine-hydrolysing)
MCGIFGVLFPSFDSGECVSRMREILRHRGPDGEGVVHLPDGVLGHLRLSILDLSENGAQPMWDIERRACITYNGEIYNFPELRRECEDAGIHFRSTSDTEVILGQYLLHGDRAFERLNGIFAFCLYDRRNELYYLVRDRVGIKPLYYADTPRGLFFASELGALMGSGAVEPQVDSAALQAFLQLDFVPGPLSIIRNVRKLVGGEAMRLTSRGERFRWRYAGLRSDPKSQRPDASVSDVEEFGCIFSAAVKRQLVADVPVGVFLSGGLDSSTVAATAAEVSARAISTFSIGFEEPSFDESRYFEAVAQKIGSNHHQQTVRATDILGLISSLPRICSEPLADGSIFPTYLLSRFTRGHVKVALSGDGADELFGGYPTYRAAVWSRRFPRLVRRGAPFALQVAHRVLPVRYDNFSFDFKVKKFLTGVNEDEILQHHQWMGTFLPSELPLLLADYQEERPEFQSLLRQPVQGLEQAPLLDRLLATDQRFYLQDGVLVKVDRSSMAVSLEVRVPFLDNEMIAFANRLPPDRKVRGRQFKRILKQFARMKVPREVIERPKKGFGTPLGHWFRGELRDLIGDVLSPAEIRRTGFFRPEFIDRLVKDHWQGKRDNRKQLFNLLVFHLWFADISRTTPAARYADQLI